MSTNVLYGTGKPRFELKTGSILFAYTSVIISANSCEFTVVSNPNMLSNLDSMSILISRVVSGTNSTGGVTIGVITSYIDNSDTDKMIYIDAWTNGTPVSITDIKDFRIDLPYCQVFLNEPETDFIVRKLYGGKIDIYKRGFYHNWRLDYSGYTTAQTLNMIRPLYSSLYGGFIFYPRNDNLAISFKVDVSDKLSLSQLAFNQGHRGLVINLIGVERLPEVNLTPAALVLPDGFGYEPFGGSDVNPYGDND